MVGGTSKGGLDGGLREGASDELFRGAVVRGGVEGTNSEGEGARDYRARGEGEGVGVVLVVEGCGAAD